MTPRRFDLLIFDWDGTLMDSTGSITRSIQLAAQDLGLPVPTDREASHVIGLSLQDALQYAIPTLASEDYPALVERYRFHFLGFDANIGMFDEIPEMLNELKERGYALAVATGKTRAGLDRVLESTTLRGMFDATRTADETRSKPHPQMVLELVEHFGFPASSCIMVGDTTHDLQMAIGAKVNPLGVSYGAHPHESLLELGPLAVLDSSAALRSWFQHHG
jgi:phosphoglycolate phosphatase